MISIYLHSASVGPLRLGLVLLVTLSFPPLPQFINSLVLLVRYWILQFSFLLPCLLTTGVNLVPSLFSVLCKSFRIFQLVSLHHVFLYALWSNKKQSMIYMDFLLIFLLIFLVISPLTSIVAKEIHINLCCFYKFGWRI